MNFQNYRTLFQVGTLVSILLATSPALSLVVSLPEGGESLSELWLLGPNHMAEDYPFNIHIGESYRLYLGVENHLGHPAYYLVHVKFRSQTQALHNSSTSEPSSLPSVYELQFFVADGDVWETPINFEILDATVRDNTMIVKNVSINDITWQVVNSSIRNSEDNGFRFQLFFELWLYNPVKSIFQFHSRFVGIWLNITG